MLRVCTRAGFLSALHQVSAVVSDASTLRPLCLCKLCLDDQPCIHMWKHAAHFHEKAFCMCIVP